jgi:hypothetical protein
MSLDHVQQDLTEFVLSHGGLDNDDLLAQAAYEVTQWHREGPDRDLAIALFSTHCITPHKNRRRRGRPRKRVA